MKGKGLKEAGRRLDATIIMHCREWRKAPAPPSPWRTLDDSTLGHEREKGGNEQSPWGWSVETGIREHDLAGGKGKEGHKK